MIFANITKRAVYVVSRASCCWIREHMIKKKRDVNEVMQPVADCSQFTACACLLVNSWKSLIVHFPCIDDDNNGVASASDKYVDVDIAPAYSPSCIVSSFSLSKCIHYFYQSLVQTVFRDAVTVVVCWCLTKRGGGCDLSGHLASSLPRLQLNMTFPSGDKTKCAPSFSNLQCWVNDVAMFVKWEQNHYAPN